MSVSTPTTVADASAAVLDVATGILQDAHGRVLLDLRPADKPWPGYWEFPGGKMEAGESPEAALHRELAEELGITVRAATPWQVREYAYPQRRVRLHLYKVTAWEGRVHGREGQELRWLSPAAAAALHLLPANRGILADLSAEALPCPPLFLIADPQRAAAGAFLKILEQSTAAGLRALILRIKGPLPAGLDAETLADWLARAKGRGVQVYLNHLDPLPSWPVVGRHFTEAQLADCDASPSSPFGVSCHSAAGLARAEALGASYALLSPLFPTATHPHTPALGLARFAELAAAVAVPVIALGGLDARRIPEARRAGARGAAVLSEILSASDPHAATQTLIHAWNAA